MSDTAHNPAGSHDEGQAAMAFHQYALPPLTSGPFTLTVTQEVTVQGVAADAFVSRQQFYVAGERYTLAAADINSVFPPVGSQGDFSNALPHVVFNVPTLPWQRSPLPAEQAANAGLVTDGRAVPTWLAVLLFDQDDPTPSPQTLTLADLRTTAAVFFPPRQPENGEDPATPVTVVDVPLALFNAIAPSLDDLHWTAHVRAADPGAKAVTENTPLEYGVVFGNRLPVPGNVATACLVSLEHFGPYLPTNEGQPGLHFPPDTAAVRLVVLRSWSFTVLERPQGFANLFGQLNTTPAALALPYRAEQASGSPVADQAVQTAFGLGYVALNHALRDGSTTVSWYRGPLLPLALPATAPKPAAAAADELLRYDPESGLFDTTYAAAWQLGRLLALHDSAFAAALYRWKLTQTQARVSALENSLIDQEMPASVHARVEDAALPDSGVIPRAARLAAVITELVRPAVTGLHAVHQNSSAHGSSV